MRLYIHHRVGHALNISDVIQELKFDVYVVTKQSGAIHHVLRKFMFLS
jgi:hypothetical protein